MPELVELYEEGGYVQRQGCPTCIAIEQGGVGEGRRGSLTECTEAGREDSPHLPPEAARLVTIGGDDRYGELKRCPQCGTLYGYMHHYEYSSNSASDDDHTLWRVEDAVAALVAPLLEPLAPALFDAMLADALRSGNKDVRHIAIGILHGAAGKGPLDAAIVAAAEVRAAAEASRDHEIMHGCDSALSSYTRSRGASTREDEKRPHVSYGVPEPDREPAAREEPHRDSSAPFDPEGPELGWKVVEAAATSTPADSVRLGDTRVPAVLHTLAGVLPQAEGEALESQLESYDIFLGILSPAVRPEVSALLLKAAGVAADPAQRARIERAAASVARGGCAAER
ncbi:MAG: hypothetical protein HY017_00910 [Betaproteobacteria bacterium]|nr:hypothetical protein [Betaproteobacteria bacterium]